ncbi:fructose-bisphosphate aldolase [marine actinobacterium PHSC20C1]|nr:fructose-bisphosphate aldolase [marine actinobacterium PHSC20C1]
MTDPRPRPKYGEYAPVSPATPEPPTTPPNADPSLIAHQPASTQPHFANAASDAVVPERKRRLWDVLLTSTLLLFGVVDVMGTIPVLTDMGPFLREALAGQGATFTSDAVAAEAGGAANIARVVVLVLTIVFALIQIQRKRLAFWIPVVGALIAGIALMVAVFVAVLTDPGFMAYVESLQ